MASTTPPNGIAALNSDPALAPNAFFLSVFVVLLVLHVVLAVLYWRSYGYAIGMLCGLLLEMLGYVAKVQLSHNRADKDAYIMYIIGLTLGPTFLSSSLYLGISEIQRHYRARAVESIGPRLFAGLFILGDFICLCFIGVGGSLAAIYADQPIGIDLMVAGLAIQVLFTAIFCVALWILWRRMRETIISDGKRWFVCGSAFASAALFIRSCWRAAELSGGFNGPLASKEGLFIALDSSPIAIMSLVLTLLHPQVWFPQHGNALQYPRLDDRHRMIDVGHKGRYRHGSSTLSMT